MIKHSSTPQKSVGLSKDNMTKSTRLSNDWATVFFSFSLERLYINITRQRLDSIFHLAYQLCRNHKQDSLHLQVLQNKLMLTRCIWRWIQMLIEAQNHRAYILQVIFCFIFLLQFF